MTSIRLTDCLEGAGTDDFAERLSGALKSLPSGSLPLQNACDQGGRADDSDISAAVLDVAQTDDRIVSRVGVFFTEIVGGCNCGDDPLEVTAYCVLEVAIDRSNGAVAFTALND